MNYTDIRSNIKSRIYTNSNYIACVNVLQLGENSISNTKFLHFLNLAEFK